MSDLDKIKECIIGVLTLKLHDLDKVLSDCGYTAVRIAPLEYLINDSMIIKLILDRGKRKVCKACGRVSNGACRVHPFAGVEDASVEYISDVVDITSDYVSMIVSELRLHSHVHVFAGTKALDRDTATPCMELPSRGIARRVAAEMINAEYHESIDEVRPRAPMRGSVDPYQLLTERLIQEEEELSEGGSDCLSALSSSPAWVVGILVASDGGHNVARTRNGTLYTKVTWRQPCSEKSDKPILLLIEDDEVGKRTTVKIRRVGEYMYIDLNEEKQDNKNNKNKSNALRAGW